MGFANVVDSLYAVKKTVFEDKRFTMADLTEWLSNDWQDAEDKRAYLLNRVPKYGNDNDDVDAMALRVIDHYCDVLSKYSNFRGGAFWPGIFSVGFHITMGAFTGATPDGRFAGDVLGNGITPTTGNAVSGPTAIMNSVVKLPVERVYNGANLNMRFQGKKISTENLTTLSIPISGMAARKCSSTWWIRQSSGMRSCIRKSTVTYSFGSAAIRQNSPV